MSSRSRYARFVQTFRKDYALQLSDYPTPTNDTDDVPQAYAERGYLRDYMSWMWKFRRHAAVLIVASLIATGLDLVHPLFLRYILDHVLLASSLTPEQRIRSLHVVGVLFLAIIVFQQLLGMFMGYQQQLLNMRVILSLRRSMYKRLMKLPLAKLSSMKTGGIITRLTGDVNATSGLMQLGLIAPAAAIIRLLATIGILFVLSWQLTVAALLVIPIVTLLNYAIARRIRPIYRALRDDASVVDGRVGEAFGGIRVVRAFQRESKELLEYTVGWHSIIRKGLFAHRRQLALFTTWGFLMVAIGMLTVWLGGYYYIQGKATIGDILAFQVYVTLLVSPVSQIVNSFTELQRALASMDRVFEILLFKPSMPDVSGAQDPPTHVSEVRFDDVCFEYVKGKPVLRNVNATVQGGSMVAIVGRSGAGKTTITDLVARFHDPSSGRILVNGQDIRQFRLRGYRSLVGIVEQTTFLFDGSVSDNIAYGRPKATLDQIIDAARRSHAHDFIMTLQSGYETFVGERGVKLSGGQAQRISIARAILADPQILILDEATSNLDTESEQLIQESLRELLKGRTTFVIAHRLSTISEADSILVLENGRVLEQGHHHELMRRDGRYAEMIARQQELIR